MNIIKKFNLNKPNNILFLLLVGYLFWQKIPILRNSYEVEGKQIPSGFYSTLNGTPISLKDDSKKILFFWATWCAPCKLEMSRFHQVILDKEIASSSVYFVNMNENNETIRKFLKRENYNINVILDQRGELANYFKVIATPTVIHLGKKEVEGVYTGISPLGLIRAKWFLKD